MTSREPAPANLLRDPVAFPPNERAVRLAIVIVALLLGAAFLTAPYASIQLTGTEPLLSAYAAAVLVTDVLTAALLLSLYSILRSGAILLLAIGYLFVGLSVIPWVMTFPGAMSMLGLPPPDLQATATVAVFRRLVFPLCIIAYILLKRAPFNRLPLGDGRRRAVWLSVLLTTASVVALSWFVMWSGNDLPDFMADSRSPSRLWQYIPAASLLLYFIAIALLLTQRRSLLDLWLIVVLVTLVIEILLLSYLGPTRLSVGWWAGRIYGLISASTVLIALLSEMTTLYTRLVRSTASERRIREDRLAATQALLALVAHEVNQPLTSMVTNAGTSLRWMDRQEPNWEEASAALRRVVRDGHRAGEIIRGIRKLYGKGTQERVPLNINSEIRQAVDLLKPELNSEHISIEWKLQDDLPLVNGNSIQIQQVLTNLIKNSIDAMQGVSRRRRHLSLYSSNYGVDAVLVSVADHGLGIAAELKEDIFAPFVTTKPGGMGMGLMFSRSIIEAHGGRLWLEDAYPNGAIFKFTLPVSHSP